jgi:hypothetical protein
MNKKELRFLSLNDDLNMLFISIFIFFGIYACSGDCSIKLFAGIIQIILTITALFYQYNKKSGLMTLKKELGLVKNGRKKV